MSSGDGGGDASAAGSWGSVGSCQSRTWKEAWEGGGRAVCEMVVVATVRAAGRSVRRRVVFGTRWARAMPTRAQPQPSSRAVKGGGGFAWEGGDDGVRAAVVLRWDTRARPASLEKGC
jgi:hypothetical protein